MCVPWQRWKGIVEVNQVLSTELLSLYFEGNREP